MKNQQSQVAHSHAVDAGGLPDGNGRHRLEFLPAFRRQAHNLIVGEIRRDGKVFQFLKPFDLTVLFVDVPLVLHFQLSLIPYRFSIVVQLNDGLKHIIDGYFRVLQSDIGILLLITMLVEQFLHRFDFPHLFLQAFQRFLPLQSDGTSLGRQTLVTGVVPQVKPVFRPAGEHPIGFGGAHELGDLILFPFSAMLSCGKKTN